MQKPRVLTLAAVALAGLFACINGCTSDDPHTIKIVSSLPRTGSARAQTETIVNGIKMALADVDYKVGDFKIVYEDLDDATASSGQWQPDAETRNAKQAVSDRSVMVYIGTYNSGAAKISMPILNKAGLLMISPANTTPGLTKKDLGDSDEPGKYRPSGKLNYCRVVPTDDLQGPLGAEWAADMGLKNVFILDDNEAYGKGIADLFEDRAKNLPLKVLGHEHIDPKAVEFKSLMTKIKNLKPDLVYFGGTTQSKGGQIATDLADILDPSCKMMVPDGCYEKAFLESGGAKLIDRCYVTFGGVPPDVMQKNGGLGKAFVDKYVAEHKQLPEGYAAYGHECARVALEAIRKAGKKDRDAIREACLAIKDFEGTLGKWSFDENGDTTLKVLSGSMVRKVDGKADFAFEKLLEQKSK